MDGCVVAKIVSEGVCEPSTHARTAIFAKNIHTYDFVSIPLIETGSIRTKHARRIKNMIGMYVIVHTVNTYIGTPPTSYVQYELPAREDPTLATN